MINFSLPEVKLMMGYLPHVKKLGIEAVDLQEKSLTLKLPFHEALEIIEGTGVVAHGAITTLVDTAFGAITMRQFHELKAIATIDLRVDFMGASKPFQDVYAEVTCTKVTREVVFVRGEIYCDKERPFAQAVAAFSYSDMRARSKKKPKEQGDEK